MNTVTIEIHPALSPESVTREQRYAHGVNGGAVNVAVIRRGDTYRVTWNVNDGRAWSKGWRTAPMASEAKALAFATSKFATLTAWLEQLAPKASGGAAAAFSASLGGAS